MTIAVISMIRDAWGGSEELWAAMAEEALDRGYRVIHVTYRFTPLHPKMQALLKKGLVTYYRPSYKQVPGTTLQVIINRGVFFIQKRLNRALEKMLNERPDVILYNGTCYSIADETKLLERLAKLQNRFYILGHFNREDGSDLAETAIPIIKKAYARSKQVLFITERSIQKARLFLTTNIPNALVVRNPVNISSTEIMPFPIGETVQFAMVGNLVMVHKGQDIALEVLATERWKQRQWHLNIYGSGHDETALKNLVNSLDLKNNVSFHGRVTDIRAVWRNSNMLLMPSRMEGMPLAVVEAMICGRPSVVTDVGGHTEWVEEGKQGFIAAAANALGFGEALERAWSAKSNWDAMGQLAHEKALELYDPHAGRTLLRLLEKN
jgi:L-malate glycosyltransferase